MSVSETIGKLLLEGYKMLADSCEICSTVLMQDRTGRVLCVQCTSLSLANSDGDDSGPPANGKHSNANKANSSFSTCEDVLTNEIHNTTSALQLLSRHQHSDMQAKLLHIKYIRECAETIRLIRGLKMPQC